jgi:predicted Holliday junction resolvase-like endonuclease
MAHVDFTGSIGSLLDFYKHEKQIFGCCPRCGSPFRLSEEKLTFGKEPPRDLLSRMRRQREAVEAELEELDCRILEMEEEHGRKLEALNEKWEIRVDAEVEKQLVKTKRLIRKEAVAQSRVSQLGKTLEKIAPMFPGFGHHPADVRPVFDPIDFVIFDGYFQGEVTGVTFVEFKTSESKLTGIQRSIRDAVDRKRVRFEERRLRKETLRLLTDGRGRSLRRLVD